VGPDMFRPSKPKGTRLATGPSALKSLGEGYAAAMS
jgi:hypothetical protein